MCSPSRCFSMPSVCESACYCFPEFYFRTKRLVLSCLYSFDKSHSLGINRVLIVSGDSFDHEDISDGEGKEVQRCNTKNRWEDSHHQDASESRTSQFRHKCFQLRIHIPLPFNYFIYPIYRPTPITAANKEQISTQINQ